MRRRPVGEITLAMLAALALGIAFPRPGAAQQTGAVSGQVVDRANGRPLSGAQVALSVAGLGALTDAAGRYRIERVPAGIYRVEVTFMGYRTAAAEVTVSAGQPAVQDFHLALTALPLDEIVVTGAGVATQRKRLGQTISTVSNQQLQNSPVVSLTDALTGRVPGLVANNLGETGAGAQIRLRGVVSLSQRNDPIIYIDGVRVDNHQHRLAGIVTTRLDDLNPADVDRIEVIKGAAAATLYGTEASAGVIQIFTKRGQVGTPGYTVQIDQQAIRTPQGRIEANYAYDPGSGQVASNFPAADFLRTGHYQSYELSASGGSEGVRYYASGRFKKEDGTLPTNNLTNESLHMSLDFTHSDKVTSKVDVNISRNDLRAPYPGWGLFGEFILADPTHVSDLRPYGELFYTVKGATAYNNHQNATNGTISGAVNISWSKSLHSNVTVGYNEIISEQVISIPVGAGLRDSDGVRQITNEKRASTTVDFRNSLEHSLTPELHSQTVFGGQSFWRNADEQTTGVRNFPAPTLKTLRGGSTVYTVDETAEQVINAGVFVQEQLGYQDRLFLTGGLRLDGNSAFGENFGFQAYPKAGISWVVSDYGFWNLGDHGWDELRLRAAFGTSGLQPGAFDAQRTWRPASLVENNTAVLPENLGNPDLKPERSREIELAAELGFFEGRLGLEIVHFDQRTSDALLPKQGAPSSGFTNPQLTNIGQTSSKGWEISTNVGVLDRPNFRWDLNANFSTQHSLVVDMGGISSFRITGGRRYNRIQEGYAPGDVLAPVEDPSNPYSMSVPVGQLTKLNQIQPNFLKANNGEDSLVYIGHALPTWSGSVGTTFRLAFGLELRARVNYQGGFIMSNETELIRAAIGITPDVATWTKELADPSTSASRRQEIADMYGTKHPRVISAWMENGKFLRFSELTLSYRVPNDLATQFGLGSTTVTVGARNLLLLTGYSGMNDPGTTTVPENAFVQNIDYFGAPIPRRLTFSLRTTLR